MLPMRNPIVRTFGNAIAHAANFSNRVITEPIWGLFGDLWEKAGKNGFGKHNHDNPVIAFWHVGDGEMSILPRRYGMCSSFCLIHVIKESVVLNFKRCGYFGRIKFFALSVGTFIVLPTLSSLA